MPFYCHYIVTSTDQWHDEIHFQKALLCKYWLCVFDYKANIHVVEILIVRIAEQKLTTRKNAHEILTDENIII